MNEKIVWNILLVDDDEDDYLLTRQMLTMAHGKEVQVKWAKSFAEGRQVLFGEHFDAALIDYDLGEHTGLELIQEAAAKHSTVPLILITGRGGYEVDLEAMQAGATLYLTKSELNPQLLDRSIRYAIERKLAEIMLKEAREELEGRVQERTQELAQANQELLRAKQSLEASVADRTAELKQANTLLARQTSLYATLSQVNEAIVRTRDEATLFAQLCEIIARAGFLVVWIGLVKDQVVVPVAKSGPALGYLAEIKVEVQGPLSKGPTGTCICENHPVVNADFATNPATTAWQEPALRFGIRSSAAFPLCKRSEVVGALTLYAAEANAFDSEQIALLERLAADISFALDAMDQENMRLAAEQALRTNGERYRSLFEGMTEGFALHEIICDEQGKPMDWRFLEINPAFERLTGLRRQDVVGQLHNTLLPDDDPRWVEIYGAVALGGEPVHFENYSTALKQYYEVYAFCPAPRQFAVLFMNITERKLMDEKLRQSEQRFRTLFEGMQEGFYVARIVEDEDGRACDYEYLEANQAFGRIMGLPPEKIVGRTAKELVPGLKQEWVEVFSKVQASGEPAYHSSYSEYFRQYFEAFAYRPVEGQFAVLVSDITERKQAEERLEQLSQLVELSYDPIFVWDFESGIMSWNRGSEQLYGYSKAEAVGQISHDLLKTRPPMPIEMVLAELSEKKSWTGELHHWVKDGREVIVESRLRLIERMGRRLVLESNRDITERKRIEQALLETNERIQWVARFPEENPNPVVRASLAGQVLYHNPPAGRLPEWGCVIGQPVPAVLIAVIEQAVARGREVSEDIQLENKPYSVSVIPLLKEGYVNVYGRDIARRKQAEEALRQSEDWFRTTLASIGDAVVTTDGNGLITFLNPVAEKLSGWKRQEATGLPMEGVFPLINEQTGQPAENPIGRVLQSGLVVGLANHTCLIPRQGEAIPIEDSASPIIDFDGNTLGVVMVFHDVTEKRRKEAELQRSEALYRAIAHNFPDGGVFVVDHNLRYVLMEGAILEAIGWSRERMEGHLLSEVLEPEAMEIVETRYRRTLAGESLSFETPYHGRTLWSKYLPLLDEAGAVLAAMVITIDVTARKRDEETLREAEGLMKAYAQQLERSNRELQDFAVIASHDLQEPLRKIKAFSDLLQVHLEGRLDDLDKDYLGRMRNATQRMQELIESLLTYSRVATRTQPFRKVNLRSIVVEVLSGFDVQIERLGAKIELGELPELEADPTQIHQLLQNLVSNALKFRRPGVPPVVQISGTIEVSPNGQEGDFARIVVKDNGIGFDMKYLERIFQPFERLHGRNEFEGTGMGLPICKKIVDRHQGTITALSIPGEVTTFIVTLPINLKG